MNPTKGVEFSLILLKHTVINIYIYIYINIIFSVVLCKWKAVSHIKGSLREGAKNNVWTQQGGRNEVRKCYIIRTLTKHYADQMKVDKRDM